jgi:hypothetical protein
MGGGAAAIKKLDFSRFSVSIAESLESMRERQKAVLRLFAIDLQVRSTPAGVSVEFARFRMIAVEYFCFLMFSLHSNSGQ